MNEQPTFLLKQLESLIETAESHGINGIALFNETGYFKYNQLDNISDSELHSRISNMQWYLTAVDGWLTKRLKRSN